MRTAHSAGRKSKPYPSDVGVAISLTGQTGQHVLRPGRFAALANGRLPAHITSMLPGSITTERFTCPNCGLAYLAIREWFCPDTSGGRFECIDCFAEVHSWSGPNDYIGWTPTTFGKKRD
jgi:hypothetical protein